MNTLIQNKLNKSKNTSDMLLSHSNEVIFANEVFDNRIYFDEISTSTLNNKIIKWLKHSLWNLIISPFFLFSCILLYIFAPSKIFGEKVRTAFLRTITVYIKRIFDIIGAVVGIILSSVFFLMLPILIKLDSNGPVFYSQVRVGQNRRKKNRRIISASILENRRNGDRRKQNSYGKPFVIYKFRTMREDAEKKCGPVWASDNDPRITPIGRILRFTHLDELPQLYNILKGDMSFVGPRPERPYFVNQLVKAIPGYINRLNVKPGLTGLAQIKTGYDYSIESVKTKLHYDLEYYKNGNLVSYFKIMFVTIFKTMIGKTRI